LAPFTIAPIHPSAARSTEELAMRQRDAARQESDQVRDDPAKRANEVVRPYVREIAGKPICFEPP